MPHLHTKQPHRGVHIGDCESLVVVAQWWSSDNLSQEPCVQSPVTGTFSLVALHSRMQKPYILWYGRKIWQRIKFGGLAARQARHQIKFRQIFVQISNWSSSTRQKTSISQCH